MALLPVGRPIQRLMCRSSITCGKIGMINPREGQVDAAATIASAHNRPGTDTAKSWFVPPIVVPAFLMILIVARAFYSAFS